LRDLTWLESKGPGAKVLAIGALFTLALTPALQPLLGVTLTAVPRDNRNLRKAASAT
jgi:cytochrome c biogenesis protein CcdA